MCSLNNGPLDDPNGNGFSNLEDPNFNDLPGDTFEIPESSIITRPSKMNDDEDIPF